MNNLSMLEEIDFSSLGIPIPETVFKYSIEKQRETFEYLKSMDTCHKQAYLIANDHLGTSFNVYKSNGFKEWKNKK
jgi:hypothetical protein